MQSPPSKHRAKTTAPGAKKVKSKTPGLEISDKEIMERVQEGSLAWHKDLLRTPSLVRELLTLSDSELPRRLAEVLQLSECETNLANAASLEYFLAGFSFGKEHNFSEMSLSALLTLLHVLLENCREKKMSLTDNHTIFREMMARHVGGDEENVMDFEPSKAALIHDHLAKGLFLHYRLYQAAPAEPVSFFTATITIEHPPSLPSMATAVPQAATRPVSAAPPHPPSAHAK
eukprot:m.121427 g.121427  ORF g.121427 m.121427 type:complete len:231 (-) comp14575_c0_seq8:45-737(-)